MQLSTPVKIWLLISLALVSFQSKANICPNWSKEFAVRQFENLSYDLNLANREYRLNGKSNLTDQEYDYLKNQLNLWQKCFSFLPQKLQRDYLYGGKVAHLVAHSRIYKAKSEQEINAFLHRNSENGVWLMPKIDGIAVSLTYTNGVLTKAITRGDGNYGEDVTKNIKLLKKIPQKLNSKLDLLLQGELYWIHSSRIEKDTILSNGREKIMGFLLKQNPLALKDTNPESPVNKIKFFAWEAPKFQDSMSERLEFLEKQGFVETKKFTYKTTSLEQIKELKNFFHTKPMEFATDGIVLTKDKRPDFKKWTTGEKYWSIAWKHEFKSSLTKILRIEFSIGRTGKITPIAHLEPLKIQGRIYRKASLGSLNKLKQMNLRNGAIVELELAGGIIAQIKKPVWQSLNTETIKVPDFSYYNYTSCLTYKRQCRQQFLARLVYMSEKLPINGVKQATWETMLDAGLIKNLTDWQKITEEDLLKIPGVGAKKSANILASFKTALEQVYIKQLYSLGVPLSLNTLYELEQKFNLKNNFKSWSLLKLKDFEDLGISENSAKKTQDYLSSLYSSTK